jgi:hypothetical protein
LNRKWKGKLQHDTIFVKVSDANNSADNEIDIMHGMLIARVLLFFSFRDPILHEDIEEIPCALVNWFIPISQRHDKAMGMWEVKLEMAGTWLTSEVIHLDSIVWGAHLLPHYGSGFLPEDFDARDALNAFWSYFINQLIDYHVHALLQDN